MNRTALTWSIVLIILIVGLGLWYSYSTSGAAPTQSDAGATTTALTAGTETSAANLSSGTSAASGSSGSTAGTNTFRSIFTQSGNNQCTYAAVTASIQSHNVVDIAGGKMHAEFRTTGSVTTADLMTYSNGILYVWKEGATTGTKTSITSLADLPDAIPQDLTSGAVLGNSDNNVSWDCHAWNKDSSAFTIPSFVTFSWKA